MKPIKKVTNSLIRWQSEFALTQDAMRYMRKIADFSYRKYLPDCPGAITP